MPQAVTHILVPIILVALFRDFYLKNKNKKEFPLHYVMIAGLGGVLPDIDIVLSYFLNFLGFAQWNIHKTFTHSIFFPLCFFILFLIFLPAHEKAKICNLGRHKLKLSTIFLMLSIGILTHILLDFLIGGPAYFLYPFYQTDSALYLMQYLPQALQSSSMALLDGILLVIWLSYLEFKHKISDFI